MTFKEILFKDLKDYIPSSSDELIYCKDKEKMYIYNEELGWIPFEGANGELKLNLYELNKNIINQLEPLTMDEVKAKMEMIKNYYYKTNNTYHMLLCRDYNYYTIFTHDFMRTFPDFASAVCTIITELGNVYSIENTNDGAMEIWIKPDGEENPYAFYLFPYDAGVVYYG